MTIAREREREGIPCVYAEDNRGEAWSGRRRSRKRGGAPTAAPAGSAACGLLCGFGHGGRAGAVWVPWECAQGRAVLANT